MSYGPDGAVLIDDQFAPLTDRIVAAVDKLGGKPVRYLINTHWHYDHRGGNENLGKMGGAFINTEAFAKAIWASLEAAPAKPHKH